MMVCKDHVIRGIRLLPVPHVNELSVDTKKSCTFCDQQAKFRLYLSDRNTHFIIQKKARQKKEKVVWLPTALEV